MNKNPSLLCEGSCKKVTHHSFAGENMRKNSAGEISGYEQLFECDYCGKKRRFGYTAWGCVKGSASWGTKTADATLVN